MYRILYAILTIVWILDIVNFPGMEFLDTTYPVNMEDKMERSISDLLMLAILVVIAIFLLGG